VLFFTINIAERNKSLLIDHIDELRGAFKKIKQNHPFIIEAIVILPDHIHTLWQLPEQLVQSVLCLMSVTLLNMVNYPII